MQLQNLTLWSFKEHYVSLVGESFEFPGNLDWEIRFLEKGYCALTKQKIG